MQDAAAVQEGPVAVRPLGKLKRTTVANDFVIAAESDGLEAPGFGGRQFRDANGPVRGEPEFAPTSLATVKGETTAVGQAGDGLNDPVEVPGRQRWRFVKQGLSC